MIAAAEGRIGLLKLLVENKADPEINDANNIMFMAIDYTDEEPPWVSPIAVNILL